jgi:hypothetical protein
MDFEGKRSRKDKRLRKEKRENTLKTSGMRFIIARIRF